MLTSHHADQFAMIFVKTPTTRIPDFLSSLYEEEIKVDGPRINNIEQGATPGGEPPYQARVEGSEILRVEMQPN